MTPASPRFGAVMSVASVVVLAATGGSGNDQAPIAQPIIGARAKTVLTVAGRQFKDSNGNGVLDPYEDWRLAVDTVSMTSSRI